MSQELTKISLIEKCTFLSPPVKWNYPESTLIILCDLSKACDVIDHRILQKLHTYGIRGIANKWFESYLSGRQ